MTAREGLAIGSIIARKYRISKLLGAGGMGAVYLAENLDIGRQVALKVLHAKLGRDPHMMARFRQEARATAAIDHPGIVEVLDMGQTEGGDSYIVMERLEGETLAARIHQRGRLTVEETISIMSEVLDAIAAAHDKGIVHRDLKPDNLFLVWRPRWGVKILDFGISRLAHPDEVRLTETNMTMGTLLYMPPEQARDARTAGPAADLYAIGAVMYHALAGRPPFLGVNQTEVLSSLLTDLPQPLAQVAPTTPGVLAQLVDQLLAKSPANRPANARVVREQMLAVVGGRTSAPRPLERAEAFAAVETPAPARTPAPVQAPALAPTMATAAPSAPPRVMSEAPERRASRWWLPLSIVAGLGGVGAGIVAMTARQQSSAPADSSPATSVTPPPIADAAERMSTVAADAAIDAPADASPKQHVDAGVTHTPQRRLDAGGAPARVDAAVEVTPPPDAGHNTPPPDAGHKMTDFQDRPP